MRISAFEVSDLPAQLRLYVDVGTAKFRKSAILSAQVSRTTQSYSESSFENLSYIADVCSVLAYLCIRIHITCMCTYMHIHIHIHISKSSRLSVKLSMHAANTETTPLSKVSTCGFLLNLYLAIVHGTKYSQGKICVSKVSTCGCAFCV